MSVLQHQQGVRVDSPASQLSAIMRNLQYEFTDYKYTVYRCAAKVVTLQKIFHTSSIPYKLVLAVLNRHGIRDADINLMVPPFLLTSLLHDIYFACEKLGHFTKATTYQLESSTGILANFFWNIFDPNRRHSISLLEIKFTFMLLCKLCNGEQLATEMYTLLSNAKTNCVSRLKFESLLNILTKIFTYLGEENAYGVHNSPVVLEQCFSRCQNTLGLTEHQFHCLWNTTQTRFLIYGNLLSLIKRMEDTERLVHTNSCACCRSDKIIGIRFKCQSCSNLSLCLRCFATGFATNKHEAGHRMYEVFSEDLPPKKLSHYFAKLCNMFCARKNNDDTRAFCIPSETGTNNETELVTIGSQNSSTTSTTISIDPVICHQQCSKESMGVDGKPNSIEKFEPSLVGLSNAASNASNTSERLQIIIDKLVDQNAKLEAQLRRVKIASHHEICEFLSAHQNFLISIIEEMKSFNTNNSLNSYPTSSTPNRFGSKKSAIAVHSFNNSGSNLTHSINGADLNRSYLEANKSDYSIQDLSSWFNKRRSLPSQKIKQMTALTEITNTNETQDINHFGNFPQEDSLQIVEVSTTDMTNFRQLLHKVREIVDDSYSDNSDLAEATQNLENVLDSIIKCEESRRKSP